MIYLFDMIILLLQAVRSSGEEVLYGLLLVIIYTLVLDKCLLYGQNKIQIKIISEKNEEIRQAILQDIDRGVTLMKGIKGYSGEPTDMVLTVISNR